MDTFVVHEPSFPVQQDVNPEIAVPRPRRCKIMHAQHQRRLIGRVRLVPHRRSIDAQRLSTAPFADNMGRLHVRDELAPPPRRQSFF